MPGSKRTDLYEEWKGRMRERYGQDWKPGAAIAGPAPAAPKAVASPARAASRHASAAVPSLPLGSEVTTEQVGAVQDALESASQKNLHASRRLGQYSASLVSAGEEILFRNTQFKSPERVDGMQMPFYRAGLHFHISLPQGDSFRQACDIVGQVLMKHGIVKFRLPRPGAERTLSAETAGRDIEVRARQEPCDRTQPGWQQQLQARWNTIFNEIIEKFVENGISPGYKPPALESPDANGPFPVKGTEFVTYSFENSTVLGKGVGAALRGIEVSVENQLPALPPYEPPQAAAAATISSAAR